MLLVSLIIFLNCDRIRLAWSQQLDETMYENIELPYLESDLPTVHVMKDKDISKPDPDLLKVETENTINMEYFSNATKRPSGYMSCGVGGDMNDECAPTPMHAVVADTRKRWVREKVKYTVSNGKFTSTELSYLKKAIQTIEANSCVRFQQVSSPGSHVVTVTKPSGPYCASDLGKLGGSQKLMLDSVCFRKGHGIAMHEMLHVLGFYHEQMRPDRDRYISVIKSNINSQFLQNFAKVPYAEVDTLGMPYDYDSIMHYGPADFGKQPGLLTIKVLSSSYRGQIGQRSNLSPLDIRKLNVAYQCGGSRSLSAQPNKPVRPAYEYDRNTGIIWIRRRK